MGSRPQQEIDLWIGQYSLRRSLMAIPPGGLREIGRGCVALGTEARRERPSGSGVSKVPSAAAGVRADGAGTGARFAGVAVFLLFPGPYGENYAPPT